MPVSELYLKRLIYRHLYMCYSTAVMLLSCGYALPRLLFAVILNVSSVMLIINITKTRRYTGNTLKPIRLPRTPNSGGIKVVPTYALAIWMPMIAPEFSEPKLYGVE